MASHADVVKQWASYYVRHVGTTQNVAGNFSTLNFKAYLNVNSSTGISWARGSASLHTSNYTLATKYAKGVYEIGTVNVNINHEADGTFPGTTIGGSINTTYMMVGNCSYTLARGDIATIPRASAIGTVNYSNFWSSFNVVYTKYYKDFTCKLRVSYPGVSVVQTFENYDSGSNVTFSSANQDAIMKKLISGNVSLGFVVETWSGGTKIGESTEKVIPISKPAVNQIASAFDFNVNDGFDIEVNKTYPNYTSTISVVVEKVTVFTATNIANSYKVRFSSSQLTQIYNAMKTVNSASFTITVSSMYGASNCGSVSVTRKGTITDAEPTLPGFSWQTINNLTLHDNKTIIKGKSNIKVTIQKATAYKGATIAYYQITVGSIVGKVTTLEATLNNVDGNTIVVYAVDTRGNAITKTMVCSKYINYTPITLDALSYERASGGIGSNVTIDFNGSMFVGGFGLQSNVIVATYYFKEVNATDSIQGTTVITPTVNAKYSKAVSIRGNLGANGFSIDKNYDLKVIVSDKLTSFTREIVISKGVPVMAIHQDGVAFGGFYDPTIGGAMQTKDIAVAGNKVLGVLGFKEYLGSNVNLNTLTIEGYYHNPSNAQASTSLNYPTAQAGLLTVINRQYIYQTYQVYDNSGFYYRSYYSGTWYPWKKVAAEGTNGYFSKLYENNITVCEFSTGTGQEYWKFSSGLMINKMIITIRSDYFSAWGATYIAGTYYPTNYGLKFISKPNVSYTAHCTNSVNDGCWIMNAGEGNNLKPGQFWLVRGDRLDGARNWNIEIISVGRWK